MAKVATDRPWLTTANHGQLVMALTVIDQDATMTMVSFGQLLNNQLKIKNLQSDISVTTVKVCLKYELKHYDKSCKLNTNY